MKALVNRTHFGTLRYIADSIKSDSQLDQSVVEAQMFEIKPWLSDSLLYELCDQYENNTLSELNLKLLNGGNYEYCDNLYTFSGLRLCIVYFAFSRYIKRDPLKFTATGIVRKNDELSEPATLKDLQMLAADATASGDALKLEVIDYLNRMYEDYPLWNYTRKKRTRTFKIVGE